MLRQRSRPAFVFPGRGTPPSGQRTVCRNFPRPAATRYGKPFPPCLPKQQRAEKQPSAPQKYHKESAERPQKPAPSLGREAATQRAGGRLPPLLTRRPCPSWGFGALPRKTLSSPLRSGGVRGIAPPAFPAFSHFPPQLRAGASPPGGRQRAFSRSPARRRVCSARAETPARIFPSTSR